MKVTKTMLITVVLVILALAGGFFAGMHYQMSKMVAQGGQYAQMRVRFGQNGQNMRPIRGQVLSIDDTGITVKMMDGTSKIVLVSPSTVFIKSASAAKTDIKSGDTVMIVGAQNSDGSLTAQNVQINPIFMQREMPSVTSMPPAQ